MGFLGGLEKLQITAYTDGEYTQLAQKLPKNPFTVFINPPSFEENFQIIYNKSQGAGSSGGSPKFNKVPSDSINFDLVFDGTGVVPDPLPGALAEDGITKQIDAFRKLCFGFDGKIHSPKFLKLAWGKTIFKGRLETLKISYTLFKPDGTPLRAKASLKIIEYTDVEELEKEANKTSPDLTHVRTVHAGDTLPRMCADIYGTSAYYLQVAAANGLTDFRDLVVGSTVVFPPVAEDAA